MGSVSMPIGPSLQDNIYIDEDGNLVISTNIDRAKIIFETSDGNSIKTRMAIDSEDSVETEPDARIYFKRVD